MNQMAASARQNSEAATAADKLSIAASNATTYGGRATDTVIKIMDGITDNAQQVGTIATSTNNIAFQTNILALSAVAGAARAGE